MLYWELSANYNNLKIKSLGAVAKRFYAHEFQMVLPPTYCTEFRLSQAVTCRRLSYNSQAILCKTHKIRIISRGKLVY